MRNIATVVVWSGFCALSFVAISMVVDFWKDWLKAPTIATWTYEEDDPPANTWVGVGYNKGSVSVRGSGHSMYMMGNEVSAASTVCSQGDPCRYVGPEIKDNVWYTVRVGVEEAK